MTVRILWLRALPLDCTHSVCACGVTRVPLGTQGTTVNRVPVCLYSRWEVGRWGTRHEHVKQLEQFHSNASALNEMKQHEREGGRER